jgi:tetratricopeptide (TPR) repeat protein
MKKTGFAAISTSATLALAACIAVGGMAVAIPLQAQSTPAASSTETGTSKIHGHAQSPLTQPIANSRVVITKDGKTPLYTFKTNDNGDYTGSGIKPGTYAVELYGQVQKNGKPTQGIIDFQRNVKFTAGGDTEVNFDLSRESYVSKLPPDVQKKIAETRKANEAAEKANVKIKNVNKLIQDARKARSAGNFDQAIALDTQATQAKPDVGLTWYELADSQLAAKKYPDAATNFQKAISVMGTEKNAKPEVLAAANNNMAEALTHIGKTNEAAAAYEAAAKADPANAGTYYQNAAITFFKKGDADAARNAAEKAIAANPNAATAYYIKGWSLVQGATINPKTGKIVLPPGTVDAYEHFLKLQPTGPMADDARSILAQSGKK